eukprot:3941722-Rhodomonas_salina.4
MDLGPSWGACSDKPRLPVTAHAHVMCSVSVIARAEMRVCSGHGFQYDPAEMERVLKLPLFELLLEFPGTVPPTNLPTLPYTSTRFALDTYPQSSATARLCRAVCTRNADD